MSEGTSCPKCGADTTTFKFNAERLCVDCYYLLRDDEAIDPKGMTEHEKVAGVFATALVAVSFFVFMWGWAIPTYLRWVFR